MPERFVVVIDVPGLKTADVESGDRAPTLHRLQEKGRLYKMMPVFPALTLPAQASMTTGLFPEEHGVVANGFYSRETFQAKFWEQEDCLVQGERVWERLKKRKPDLKTALLFFQNSLHADCDAVITPRPLHTEEGLVEWCYSKPVGLYEGISEKIGEFSLMNYWGPMAGIASSQWIAKAAVEVMAHIKPNLMFVYLPHLDYCSQKFGPHDDRTAKEVSRIDAEIGGMIDRMRGLGLPGETVFLVLSEYCFRSVQGDIPLNRIFREAGLLSIRSIKGREYLDMELSPVFAMVDHQVAHIYVKTGYEGAAIEVLKGTEGVDRVIGKEERSGHRIDHASAGDLIAVSAGDRWFSYYWWDDRSREPDFATHIDIHRKPGYDPMELFFEPGTFKISQDTGQIHGSHGRLPLEDIDLVPLIVNGWEGHPHLTDEALSIAHLPNLLEQILLG